LVNLLTPLCVLHRGITAGAALPHLDAGLFDDFQSLRKIIVDDLAGFFTAVWLYFGTQHGEVAHRGRGQYFLQYRIQLRDHSAR
jgi:hypothetical protein